MSKLSEHLRESIRAVREGRTSTLDLWREDILDGEIPAEVFTLSSLEGLSIRNAGIRVVPDRIRKLSKLKRLDLLQNPVESVPDIPGLLLEWDTYLNCQQFLSPEHVIGLHIPVKDIRNGDSLLSAVTGLMAMRRLYIGPWSITVGQNKSAYHRPIEPIQRLLDSIDQLRQLEFLMICGVRLGRIPEGIKNLTQLKNLYLDAIWPEQVPAWLFDLPALESLGLWQNGLEKIPAAIGRASNLRFLDFGDNPLRDLPQELARLTRLRKTGSELHFLR